MPGTQQSTSYWLIHHLQGRGNNNGGERDVWPKCLLSCHTAVGTRGACLNPSLAPGLRAVWMAAADTNTADQTQSAQDHGCPLPLSGGTAVWLCYAAGGCWPKPAPAWPPSISSVHATPGPPCLLPKEKCILQCTTLWDSVVMVLAEIQLMFFTEACMMQCFAFLMKVVVITHWCFSCCRTVLRQSQGRPAPHAALQRGAGREQNQDSWPGTGKGVSCTIQHCAGVKREEGGTYIAVVLVFPRNHYAWWALLSWKWLNIWSCGCGCCPWKCEWTPCFALFAWVAFALPRELSLPQPTSSHTFTFPILCPSHLGRGHAWLRGAELLLG